MLMIRLTEILMFAFTVVGGLLLAVTIVRSSARNRRAAQSMYQNERIGVDYEGIRTRVQRRYRRRFELAAHFVFYLFIVGGFWLLHFPQSALWLLAGVWALVLVVHVLQVIFAEFTDRAIERAVERQQGHMLDADKPKRDWQARLSEDGELLDVVEDDYIREETRRS